MATSNTIPIASPLISQNYVASMIDRYTDGYRKADFQTKLGGTVKVLSFIIGGIIAAPSALGALVGMAQQTFGPNPVTIVGFLGVFLGAGIGFVGWVLGVMISAQGQLLKATLDSSVNTSPFIENTDRARIMSL